MDILLRILIFLFLLGAVVLNSCHPVPKPKKDEPTLQTSLAQRIDGLKLVTEGPNCWNGALIKAGLIHSVRFVPQAEYWFWMKSPYCRPLNSKEKPENGDLGSIFWGEKGHYHSFVYRDSQWVFSKNSPDPKYEYKEQLFEEMFYPHYRNKAQICWKNFNNQFQTDATSKSSTLPTYSCEFQMMFHRCQAIEKDFYTQDPELAQWDQQIIPLEQKVFSWVSGNGQITLTEYEQVVLALDYLMKEVQAKQKMILDKQKLFKLEALEYRLMGLIYSDNNLARFAPKLYPILNNTYKLRDSKKSQMLKDIPSQKNKILSLKTIKN